MAAEATGAASRNDAAEVKDVSDVSILSFR